MKDRKTCALVLMFGSLWGFSEVFAGEFLYAHEVPRASVWLTAFALFVLGFARGLVNRPGSSTIIGALAALFKLVNAAPYWCHLLGIFFIGLVFDLGATAWMKRGKRKHLGTALTGIVSAYGGYALFAITITYIAHFEPWLRGGLPRVMQHIFIGGSLAAVAGAVMVTLGHRLGLRAEMTAQQRRDWVFAGSLVVLTVLWTLGRVIG
ncbi:MAG: hypothetical protein WAU81_11710 [Candidatus Aminicenantales bacterium]